MNIFFGKISKLFDIKQIEDGFYIAPQGSSWFGDLNIDDYVYLIGGEKIQFWRAKEWGEKDGEECLFFDILNPDLGIKISQLSMLKFLKMTKALAVMTSRSAKNRAFFKLELTKEVTPESLADSNTYLDDEIFRKIRVEKNINDIQETEDIVVYYENENLKIYPSKFLEANILEGFRDNTKFIGLGSVMKDNVLSYFNIKTKILPAILDQSKISLRSFYDTFFCEYKEKTKYFLVGAFWDTSNPQDQTERFIKEGIWFNGYEDKFQEEVKNVPVGSNISIKASFVREKTKSVMTIKARGIVTENLLDGQTLKVDWEDDFVPFEVNFGGYLVTIKEVTKADHIKSIWSPEINSLENTTDVNSTQKSQSNMNNFPLNQILYGPPGTGKTYNTVLEAAKIITGIKNMSYSDALQIFNDNINNQIEFITFHQNYSYEDFIQGIRPDTDNGKELSFEKKDGVFKRIADRALKNLTDAEKPESAKKEFDVVFQDFIVTLSEKDEIEVKMKQTSFYITQVSEKSIEFRKNQGDSQHTLSINTLRKMYNDGINEIILGGLQPYYNPILKVLLEKGKSQFTPVERKNYVIIIDEINRANISRVFGELITLIEKDKRYGGKIPLHVTLPSGDPFIVPSNLYIIGTMNTADKSIALLDIALRRRFDFVPKYPDVTLVKLEYQEIFTAINKGIFDRKNHDFTIGHAYFMEDDCTFENIINNKVIPLLLEYFMNDEKEVIAILQAATITIGGWPLKMLS